MMKNDNQKKLFALFSESGQETPTECLGLQFPHEQARRQHFISQLGQILHDADFCKRAGFPKSEDKAMLSLSDPPFYTACPNPFVGHFLEHIAAHKVEGTAPVQTEPYATDVSEGKYHPLYKLHPYPTKVPHQAIMRFILHYTKPGDIVMDGFCGTGMTGVAAMLCGDKNAVEALGLKVNSAGEIVDEKGEVISELGTRYALLSDLSPAATYVAYHYNTPIDTDAFANEATRILQEVQEECAWMYATLHAPTRQQLDRATALLADSPPSVLEDARDLPWGRINYVAWSDVFLCSECGGEVVFWDAAVDKDAGKVMSEFPCPTCKARLNKRSMQRSWTTVLDKALKKTVRQARQVPVLINYSYGKRRFEKVPDGFDIALVNQIEALDIPYDFPVAELPNGFNTQQPKGSHGLTHVHHFYTKRNLWALAAFVARVDLRLFGFAVTRVAGQVTKMYRFTYQSGTWGAGGGPLSGTLYVPSLIKELAITKQLATAIADQKKVRGLQRPRDYCISTGSSTDLANVNENSIDYVFVDPPFGGNLMYSELLFLWEAWLGVVCDNTDEAIVNDVQGKGLFEYEDLMRRCFVEFYRVLKAAGWLTVEFHNSQNAIWNAIQEAIQSAGFVVADVRTLDKRKGTIKQTTGALSVKQDLIISAYKPTESLESEFLKKAGTEAGCWDFVRTHLGRLPVFVAKDGQAEVVAERQSYLLFDRMVAFHVQRGVSVPLSAAEFYAGLRERFPERDDMYFLPEQVSEYDKKRMGVNEIVQLELFVSDEVSAIQWLKQQIGRKAQTFQELQPQFMREVSGWEKHEKPLELSELLEQSFLCFDGKGEVPSQIHSYLSSNFHELRNLDKEDAKLISKAKNRWYVPDPRKEVDLEKIRHRALMREFEVYRESKGRLKVVRAEALRAGFKECWQEGDYSTIVNMAKRVREQIIQEDPALLMYYDNAMMRTEG